MSEIEKFVSTYSSDNEEYILIKADTLKELEKKINNKIERGYLPSSSIFKEDYQFFQAMIKKEHLVPKVTCHCTHI